MSESILVVDTAPDESRQLCDVLMRHQYTAAALHSLEELAACLLENPCHGVILDLDGLAVDNRFIRRLRREHPGLWVIGISSRRFHPELEESMRTHISACLSKPVDEEELVYWLKGICGRGVQSRASPAHSEAGGQDCGKQPKVNPSQQGGSMGMEKDQGNLDVERPSEVGENNAPARTSEGLRSERRDLLQKVLVGAAAVAGAALLFERKARASAPDAGGDMARPLDAPQSLVEGSILERMRQDLLRAMKKSVSERKWVMVIDQQKCIGCCACNISCNTENNLPPGVVYRPVLREEVGKFPNVARIFTPKPCMHCDNPPCVPVCPVKATWKREDGTVVVDYDICIGCRNCLQACPYSARTADFGEFYGMGTPEIMPYETRPNFEYSKEWKRKPHSDDSPVGNARKCQFCLHRLREGMLPACVTTCLGGATYFGDFNDKNSLVHQLLGSSRVRQLKPELGTRPSVFYLT